MLVATRCGPIEDRDAGAGRLLLLLMMMVHGSSGGHGTYFSGQCTTIKLVRAKSPSFNHGGHTWVGHDDEVRVEILKLLTGEAVPKDAKLNYGAQPAKGRPSTLYK